VTPERSQEVKKVLAAPPVAAHDRNRLPPRPDLLAFSSHPTREVVCRPNELKFVWNA
jgi:hypothetical protein